MGESMGKSLEKSAVDVCSVWHGKDGGGLSDAGEPTMWFALMLLCGQFVSRDTPRKTWALVLVTVGFGVTGVLYTLGRGRRRKKPLEKDVGSKKDPARGASIQPHRRMGRG